MAATRSHLALRATAGTAAAVEVAIHAYLAPAHLDEVPYIGALFVVAAVVMTAVTAGLWTRAQRWAWLVGSAVCAGMLVAFVVSRLFGLPDYHEAWTADSGLGLLSLPPEIVFIACAVAVTDVSAVRAAVRTSAADGRRRALV